MFRVHRTDMGQQCRITQVPTWDLPPRQVLMKPRHAYLKHPALHTDRPGAPMAFHEGILHFWPFAKYAVASPRISRSIFTRASSARKRLISICSGVTPALPLPSFSFPAGFALTQFDSVCSTTPTLRAASAMLCPDSTSRTASSLNSSVYLPRFPFLIHVPFPLLEQFAKGYVLRGQAQPKHTQVLQNISFCGLDCGLRESGAGTIEGGAGVCGDEAEVRIREGALPW